MADESGLYVRFPAELLDRLRREAGLQDRSQAQLVRRAVTKYLDRLDKKEIHRMSPTKTTPGAAAPITALIGKNVLVRAVTLYYTGRLVAIEDGFLVLDGAAWIADTGRFHQALTTGLLNEVEPYPGTCYVSAGAVVDVSEWAHDLPRKQK